MLFPEAAASEYSTNSKHLENHVLLIRLSGTLIMYHLKKGYIWPFRRSCEYSEDEVVIYDSLVVPGKN